MRDPEVFLFDEPLSNLDAALRVQTRIEIAGLHSRLGTTMIYVTHDQVEAMTMADQIVVLNAGRVEQVGAPLELYHRPANLFVAGFIGSPQMNFIECRVAGVGPDEGQVGLPGGGSVSVPVLPHGVARREHHARHSPEDVRNEPRRRSHRPGRAGGGNGENDLLYVDEGQGRRLDCPRARRRRHEAGGL